MLNENINLERPADHCNDIYITDIFKLAKEQNISIEIDYMADCDQYGITIRRNLSRMRRVVGHEMLGHINMIFEQFIKERNMNFTSYFAKLPYLCGSDIVPVAITDKIPEWYAGLTYQKLAPSYDILMEYKITGNRDVYIQRFKNELLSKLNPKTVFNELMILTNGRPFCLVCYEKPDSFCHRHLVADWLTENGYECKETYLGG